MKPSPCAGGWQRVACAIREFAYLYPYFTIALLGLLSVVVHQALYNELEVRDDRGRTLLIAAAEAGAPQQVQRLLTHGAEVSAADDCGWTALMKAAAGGHREIVQLLLAHGADVNAADKGGYTSLMLAAANEHVEVMGLLVESGAELDVVDRTMGWSALIWASAEGRTRAVQFLLHHGATADRQDTEGQTALARASRNGHAAVARLLAAATDGDMQYASEDPVPTQTGGSQPEAHNLKVSSENTR